MLADVGLGDRLRITPIGDHDQWVRVLSAIPLSDGWALIRGYELRPDLSHAGGPVCVWVLQERHVSQRIPEVVTDD